MQYQVCPAPHPHLLTTMGAAEEASAHTAAESEAIVEGHAACGGDPVTIVTAEAPAQIHPAAESEAGVGGDTACGGVPVTIEIVETPAQISAAAESEATMQDSLN